MYILKLCTLVYRHSNKRLLTHHHLYQTLGHPHKYPHDIIPGNVRLWLLQMKKHEHACSHWPSGNQWWNGLTLDNLILSYHKWHKYNTTNYWTLSEKARYGMVESDQCTTSSWLIIISRPGSKLEMIKGENVTLMIFNITWSKVIYLRRQDMGR